jgi:hypothetical protein
MSLADFNELVDKAGEELDQLHLKPYLALYVFEAVVFTVSDTNPRKVHLLRKKAITKDLSGASLGRRAKEPVDVLDLNIGGHGVGGMLCVIWHGGASLVNPTK